jgi:protein-tyrosine-phosphatase
MPPAEPDRPEAYRLLFVCTGNTCRSPLAEALARGEAERRGWSHLEVASAGVSAVAGQGASEGALRVAERHGLPLDAHRSRPLTADLTAWADLILVMSPGHLRRVSELGAGERASLVDAFAHPDAAEEGRGVPDPFGGGDEDYEDTYVVLAGLVRDALDRLEPILAP